MKNSFDKLNDVDTKSINFRIWGSFALFIVIIIVFLWLLQVVFFQTYYETAKKREIITVSDQIKENINRKDIQNIIDNNAFTYSLNINLLDDEGIVVYSSNTSEVTPSMTVPEFLKISKYLKNEGKIITIKSDRFGVKMFAYTSKLNDNYYLVITTPVQLVKSTSSIIGSQLIYICIILVVVGLIISFIISKKLSRPIQDLTKAANKLAKGKYDVVFNENIPYTELRNLAKTLNMAARELNRTDVLRREILANVSHDLKTPLTMIKSYAEMIKDLPEPREKKMEHIETIINETDRLNLLVNDIIEVSKMESNVNKLKKERINLGLMLEEIIKHFSYLEKEGYHLKTKIAKNIFVKVDKKKINQAIYNLIGNAINYTGKDKKITINLSKVKNVARLEVIDTGEGIKKEDLEAIWDKYYKVEINHKRRREGTGLGLSIVKKVVVAHNLNYGVITKLGKGSQFYIEFPIDEEKQEKITKKIPKLPKKK